MFEGSKEYVVSSQDPLCLSFSKNTVIGDSKANVKVDGYIVIEGAYNSILEELIDNAILELCFEVHKEAKLSFPIPATFAVPYKLIQTNGKSMKSTKSIICYVCGENKGPNKFADHLFTCMGGPEKNSRKARTKMINFKECDSEEEDFDDYDTDASKKAKRNKNRGKSRLLGNSFSKPPCSSAPSYLEMSFDERKAFFDQRCGALTKRSKKLCSNTHKCTIHSEIERTRIRHDLLRDEPDNGQIDVDTVEKSDIKLSFSTDGSIADYPSGSLEYF